MSLYSQYLKERECKEVLETPHGFATYKIGGKEVYLEDIYVVPSHRRAGVAKAMADVVTEIAKAKGCTHMIGSVAPNAQGSQESLLVLLAYGMKIFKSDENLVYFMKRIS